MGNLQCAISHHTTLHHTTPHHTTPHYALPLPFLFQVAAVVAATNASEYLDTEAIKKTVLPRTKAIYEKSPTDVSLCLTVLGCIEKILDKLERSAIIDDVLPILADVKLQDADVTVKVVST